MAFQTLADLYRLHPAAQGAIQKSAGYAVFSDMGVNLLLLSTAHGSGLAVNSKNKQEAFMKMLSVGAGIGAGMKDFRAIFVSRQRMRSQVSLIPAGKLADRQTPRSRPVRKAERTPGRPRLRRVYGCTRSPRMVSLCKRPCRVRSIPRTTTSTSHSFCERECIRSFDFNQAPHMVRARGAGGDRLSRNPKFEVSIN